MRSGFRRHRARRYPRTRCSTPACTGPHSCRRWSRCSSPRSRSRTVQTRHAATVPAEAFDAKRARSAAPRRPSRSRCWPWRRPIRDRSAGSTRRRAPRRLRRAGPARRRTSPASEPGFSVRRTVISSRAGDLVTVVGTRPGLSERRIVVLAAPRRPGLADLSGTAALLELARVLKGRELRKTLVLVSTSGSTTGFAGARAWARDGGRRAGRRRARPRRPGRHPDRQAVGRRLAGVDGPDAAGAGAHGAGCGPARGPQRRRRPARARTVDPARGADHGLRAGTDRRRGPARGAALDDRRARPVRPRAGARRSPGRLRPRGAEHESARSTPTGPRDGPAFANAPKGIVTLRNVLPDWGARLARRLAAAARAAGRARRVLPRAPPPRPARALDRAGSRSPPCRFRSRGCGCACSARPGDRDARRAGARRGLYPLETGGIVAMVVGACSSARWRAGARGCWPRSSARRAAQEEEPAADGFARRRRPSRRRRPRRRDRDVAERVAAVAWVLNPYAAGVLVLAAHLWLFAAGGWRGWLALVAVAIGLAPVVAVAVHYGFALDLDPVGLAWGAALAAALRLGAVVDAAARRRARGAGRGRARALRPPPARPRRRPPRARRSRRAGR